MERACAYLFERPECVMVYGQGEHVDASGRTLGRYPTLPPSTPLAAFSDGCFICQPTAFFRRDAVIELGGLDGGLRTAFDFDLWLRLFKAFPDRVGFIDELQACSRLHPGAITLRMRETVALEGLKVIHDHLGLAPPHWLLTHLEELCALHPFGGDAQTLSARMQSVIARAQSWLDESANAQLTERLRTDQRVVLAGSHTYVGVHADGWAAARTPVRVRQPVRPWRALRLYGHARLPPGSLPCCITVASPNGQREVRHIDVSGPFELDLPLSDLRVGAQSVHVIQVDGGFVPAEVEPGSADRRRLAFIVEELQALA